MPFSAKQFAGSHCGCRYQQDYRPTLGRDGKKESGTLEVIKFYYDGAIRFVHAALTACCHRGGAFAHDRAGQALALLLLREGENNDQHGHGDEDDAENDLIPVH